MKIPSAFPLYLTPVIVNPIPTGQGRNQPLYERHVTKPGRNRVISAAGTYKDMRTGPHHIFGIIRGKPGLYGYMLLQTGKGITKLH